MSTSELRLKLQISHWQRAGSWMYRFLLVVAVTTFAVLWLQKATLQLTAMPTLLALIVLTFVNYVIGERDSLYPSFLFSVLWLFVMAVYTFCPIEIHQIHCATGLIILGAVASFSLGTLTDQFWLARLANSEQSHQSVPAITAPQSGFWLARWGSVAYSLATLPLFYGDIKRLAADSPFPMLVAARITLVQDVTLGINPYSSIFSSTAPEIACLSATAGAILWGAQGWSWSVLLSILLALTLAVLSSGRALLLQLSIGVVAGYLMGRRRMSISSALRKLLPLAVIVLAVMAFVGSLTKPDSDAGQSASGKAVEQSVWYIVGGVPALDLYLNEPTPRDTQPRRSIREIDILLARLGGLQHVPNTYDKFVFVPFPTNVYTAFKVYAEDFGVAAIFLICFVMGWIHHWFYRRGQAGSLLFRFLYAVSLYPMAMVPFDDLYLGFALTRHIQVVLFGLCFFVVARALEQRLHHATLVNGAH